MDLETLTQEIILVKNQIHALVVEELDQVGDPTTRYAEARRLALKVNELRSSLESIPEKKRPLFQALFYQIDPDLKFLDYAAHKAETQPEQPASTAMVIRQFSEEVFALARAFLEGKITLAEGQAKVREFNARFDEIATLPGRDLPELQRLLSEADLELTWVFNGGKGPTSLRLNRLMF